MLRDIDLVVWDFDGVLNANYDADGYIWNRMMEAELDIDGKTLRAGLFKPEFRAIMTGHIDLRDALADVLPKAGYAHGPDAFMEFWFTRDYYENDGMDALLAEVRATGTPCVIGTNNEPRRAGYIAREWGYADKVDQIYTSGHMGIAKPDHGFYDHIMQDQGVEDRARVLFIDDHPENIDAAIDFGWRTYLFGHLREKRVGRAGDLRTVLGL